MDGNKEIWFKRKKYGYGWVPATREGWMVILIYALSILALAWGNEERFESGDGILLNFVVPFVIVTAFLIYISYKKGEKPRWQWGDKR